MNSLTLLALVKSAPTIKATMKSAGDKQIATFPVEVAAYRENDPPMPLQVTAWSNLAADAERVKPGKYYVLTGRLRLEKNRPPELQINSFHAVTPLDAPGVNIVSLVGRAGRDPEARYFESGSMVANLSLAVNRNSRDDAPDWFNLEIWGKQAQIAADYVRKGSLLGITGSLKVELWTDRSTGEERSKPVIRVDRLDLLGSRRDAEGGGGAGAGGYHAPDDDSDIPF